MSEQTTFSNLIELVRRGDDQAAEELVRVYEPQIRRVVRVRMQNRRLRHAIDSMDICQSVLASFFLRAATGQYELTTPQQLVQLLAKMARNKLHDWERKQHAALRDRRREVSIDDSNVLATTAQPTPSQVLSAKELLDRALSLLDDTQRQLAMRWAAGETWEQIAADCNKSPDALRMQLRRSLDRIAQQLDVD